MYYVPVGQLDPDRIHQGDIFEDFPCFFLPSTEFQFLRTEGPEGTEGRFYAEQYLPGGWREEELLIVRAKKYKIILVSQSCDIHEESKPNLYLDENEQYANQLILYSPVIPVTALANYSKLRAAAKEPHKLENQNVAGAFYLPDHPDGHFLASIVYLHWMCSISKTKANRFKTFDPKRRLASLASPFREAFASKIGQTIERVALPTPYRFVANKPPAERQQDPAG
jgi:hypothetical protein